MIVFQGPLNAIMKKSTLDLETVVVVVAKDADVLVIHVQAYAIVKLSSRWFLRIDHEKYVDVEKVNEFLGLQCFEAFTTYSRYLGM